MAGTIDSFSHGRNVFLMQNIFIVPAMQHGCHAKPLYWLKSWRIKSGRRRRRKNYNVSYSNVIGICHFLILNMQVSGIKTFTLMCILNPKF